MSFTFAEPTEWWLEITPTAAPQQQNRRHSTPERDWVAYLNQLCLTAILAQIQTEYASEANSLPPATLDSIWEFVNGTVITAAGIRLGIMPTDETAGQELDVPQEWVDIPSWICDYYLATQIDLDARTIRVWGYATHQELKILGQYNPGDRTYCLNAEHLTRDMSTLWVTIEFCPDAQTKAEVAPLAELPPAQAEQLIQRLGNPSVVFPRLAVPFMLWGALMENDTWRQQLYQQRLGLGKTRLTAWLEGQSDALWQVVASTSSPQRLAGAWRTARSPLTNLPHGPVFDVNRVKVLEFGEQPGIEQVALWAGVSSLDGTDVAVGIQINPVENSPQLPSAIQVRLFDESGSEVGQASAVAMEAIQLEFSGSRGEEFRVEVCCGDRRLTETFEI